MSVGAIGGLMLAASAYCLITGLATETIPARWPANAWTKDEHPQAFATFIWVSVAGGLIGALLFAVSFL